MKIGLVSPYALNHGGVQEHIRALYTNFTSQNHEVKIIAPRLSREAPKKDVIFLGRAFYAESATGTGSYLTIGLHYGPIVEEILEREKFDILHFHEPMVPTISWFVLAYSKSLNIMTSHRAQRFSEEEAALYTFLKPLRLLLTKKIHGRIAVSRSAKTLAGEYFPGKYTIIPNGVDLTRFRPQGKKLPRFNDGKINLLFVGRIEPRKGLIFLLRTLANLKDGRLRLIVVGDGPLRAECERFAQRKKMDNVYFEGAVSEDDLPLYYRSADIFCSPALHGESFGIVLLEAMASNLPLVVFTNPGYRELLTDYPALQLLPRPKDTEGLSKAIITLTDDANLRHDLGLWGREKAKRYSWKKVTPEVLNFYEETQLSAKKKKEVGSISTTIEATPLPRFVKNFLTNGLVGPY